MRASSAPCGRGCKNQKFFLPFLFSSAGGVGGADKKWKGNFWFCFAASDYEMSWIYFITYRHTLSLISPSLRRDEALPLGVQWQFETLQLRPSSVVTHKADCARHKQILIVLAPPALCAHKSPPFLEDIIKQRGLLPRIYRKLPKTFPKPLSALTLYIKFALRSITNGICNITRYCAFLIS